MPRRPAALFALAFAFAVAVVAGVAAPAAAQVPPGLAATLSVPASTSLGVPVQATATFTPPTQGTAVLQVAIRLANGAGFATLTPGTNSSQLTNCTLLVNNTQVRCDWSPTGGVPQTLTVTINPVAVTPNFFVEATGGATGSTRVTLASSPFAITQQVPPTTPATTTPTTATTTAPTGPTTSSAVAPTSAAATTQPGALPPTGGSDANAFIALTVLALGAFLLIVARKVRET